MKYTDIVFDIDGTLLDTALADLVGLREALLQATGVEHTIEELYPALGVPSRDILEKYGVPERDLPRYENLWNEAMYRNFESVKVFPGIREAVKRLKERGFRLGIVTSKTRREYANEFPQFGVDKFFDVIVTADDTVEHKPCPEPLLKYLERAGANRERALYIGDSIHDLRAAKAAGVDFALAEWGLNCAEPEKARYRLSHPDDLFGIL
ncbi:MAG: HAD family hydrolase [Clostridiales bacterium]|nr:HAD family hydrolase [Clostridiales bacterium]